MRQVLVMKSQNCDRGQFENKEKHKKVICSKDAGNELLKEKLNHPLLLQESVKTKGDGIVTHFEGEGVDTEELDYEDDLSDNEEIYPLPADNEISDDGEGSGSPKPGFSGWKNPGETRKTSQMVETNEGNQSLSVVLEKEPEDRLMNNPVIQRMMEKFFEEKLEQMTASGKKMKINKDSYVEKEVKQQNSNQVGQNMVKSPSDTTIYAPALNKRVGLPVSLVQRELQGLNMNQQEGIIGQNEIIPHMLVESQIETNKPELINDQGSGSIEGLNKPNQIANFVETVRMTNHPEDANRDNVNKRQVNNPSDLELARDKAECEVLQAEKFKAIVEPPTGMALDCNPNVSSELGHLMSIGSGVSDDDFFHLTCHIEPSLIHKIEKGEYVELEKLLPKDNLGKSGEDNRLEWVQRDGGTFLVPAQRDSKIGGFRRWEQAFRAYATIYCGANPHRAKEIWQYITVINTAASSYVWDNVYNYDITFRHLMAFNPNRSWAVTYNQMWNLSMRDPLPRNQNRMTGGYSNVAGGGYAVTSRSSNGNTSHNPMQVRRKKSDYCWNFNKGVPCKFGAKCKFVERCKYCDSPSHGVHACHKLQRKDNFNKSFGPGGNNTSASTDNGRK